MDLLKGNETILVVDDSEGVRNLLSLFLKELGYKVIEAENGQIAVDIYKQNRDLISAVLMDVVMPIKNGIDASNEIKEDYPDAIIIMITGYLSEYIDKISVADFMQKPFSPIELVTRIRKSIDG